MPESPPRRKRPTRPAPEFVARPGAASPPPACGPARRRLPAPGLRAWSSASHTLRLSAAATRCIAPQSGVEFQNRPEAVGLHMVRAVFQKDIQEGKLDGLHLLNLLH